MRPVVAIATGAPRPVSWLGRVRGVAPLAFVLSSFPVFAQRPAPDTAWTAVSSELGRAGAPQGGGVVKYAFPRSDLVVVVGGVTVKPALALGSWVAFKRVSSRTAMAMGDLVLTDSEVGPVMRRLQAGGVEVTALHNHLLGESPPVMYMHIAARGAPALVARALRLALGETRTPPAGGRPPSPPPPNTLDTAGIAHALGRSGKLNGDVYQVSVPRRERISEDGQEVPSSMGVATSLNFQPTGNNRAAISGDFVLRGNEVARVSRALVAHGIQPVAIHSHMIGEEPRLYFMHFWANDDAVTLANGLRAALDLTASR